VLNNPPPPPPVNDAVYEIMWKNVVQQHRPQTTIWRMRCVYWIHVYKHTHSEYVILITFQR